MNENRQPTSKTTWATRLMEEIVRMNDPKRFLVLMLTITVVPAVGGCTECESTRRANVVTLAADVPQEIVDLSFVNPGGGSVSLDVSEAWPIISRQLRPQRRTQFTKRGQIAGQLIVVGQAATAEYILFAEPKLLKKVGGKRTCYLMDADDHERLMDLIRTAQGGSFDVWRPNVRRRKPDVSTSDPDPSGRP